MLFFRQRGRERTEKEGRGEGPGPLYVYIPEKLSNKPKFGSSNEKKKEDEAKLSSQKCTAIKQTRTGVGHWTLDVGLLI